MRFMGVQGSAFLRARLLVGIATLALVAGCGSVAPTAAPSAVETPRMAAAVPTPASVETPSGSPSAPALEGVSLELRCGGGLMQSSIIDYANEARGVSDILAATRALRGVVPTDLVVTQGDSTLVVRGGQAIWRGDWFNLGRGFLLGGWSACEGIQIGV
jgi:hypothetical protein